MVKKWLSSKIQGCNIGSSYWLMQRITASITFVYMVIIGIFLKRNPSTNFYTWKNFYSKPTLTILSTLFLLSLCWHSWLGMRTIINRYIPSSTTNYIVLSIITILALFYSVWGITIIWGL
jgi:succinate dehydrogenase / fumarate reductase membrane anchor subunit